MSEQIASDMAAELSAEDAKAWSLDEVRTALISYIASVLYRDDVEQRLRRAERRVIEASNDLYRQLNSLPNELYMGEDVAVRTADGKLWHVRIDIDGDHAHRVTELMEA